MGKAEYDPAGYELEVGIPALRRAGGEKKALAEQRAIQALGGDVRLQVDRLTSAMGSIISIRGGREMELIRKENHEGWSVYIAIIHGVTNGGRALIPLKVGRDLKFAKQIANRLIGKNGHGYVTEVGGDYYLRVSVKYSEGQYDCEGMGAMIISLLSRIQEAKEEISRFTFDASIRDQLDQQVQARLPVQPINLN